MSPRKSRSCHAIVVKFNFTSFDVLLRLLNELWVRVAGRCVFSLWGDNLESNSGVTNARHLLPVCYLRERKWWCSAHLCMVISHNSSSVTVHFLWSRKISEYGWPSPYLPILNYTESRLGWTRCVKIAFISFQFTYNIGKNIVPFFPLF